MLVCIVVINIHYSNNLLRTRSLLLLNVLWSSKVKQKRLILKFHLPGKLGWQTRKQIIGKFQWNFASQWYRIDRSKVGVSLLFAMEDLVCTYLSPKVITLYNKCMQIDHIGGVFIHFFSSILTLWKFIAHMFVEVLSFSIRFELKLKSRKLK